MKKLITLSLLLTGLLGCEPGGNVLEKTVRFNGTIKNGDTGELMPDVKVKLKLSALEFATKQFLTTWDSTTTDHSGNYDFSKTFDRSKIRFSSYSIVPSKDYYENCLGNDIGIMPNGIIIEMQVDTVSINTDTKKICPTGQIKFIATKLEVAKHDTLFFQQTIETTSSDFITEKQYAALPVSEIYFKYFTKKAISVNFALTIKKESGLINDTNQMVILQSGITKELKIDY